MVAVLPERNNEGKGKVVNFIRVSKRKENVLAGSVSQALFRK